MTMFRRGLFLALLSLFGCRPEPQVTGEIQAVMIWSEALTDEEILVAYRDPRTWRVYAANGALRAIGGWDWRKGEFWEKCFDEKGETLCE